MFCYVMVCVACVSVCLVSSLCFVLCCSGVFVVLCLRCVVLFAVLCWFDMVVLIYLRRAAYC